MAYQELGFTRQGSKIVTTMRKWDSVYIRADYTEICRWDISQATQIIDILTKLVEEAKEYKPEVNEKKAALMSRLNELSTEFFKIREELTSL